MIHALLQLREMMKLSIRHLEGASVLVSSGRGVGFEPVNRVLSCATTAVIARPIIKKIIDR